MATKEPCTHARPSAEDAVRITRIGEEICTRVEEMARIVARMHGRRLALPVIEYQHQESRDVEVAWHEFITVDGETGCYDNVHNVSCSGPCPCE